MAEPKQANEEDSSPEKQSAGQAADQKEATADKLVLAEVKHTISIEVESLSQSTNTTDAKVKDAKQQEGKDHSLEISQQVLELTQNFTCDVGIPHSSSAGDAAPSTQASPVFHTEHIAGAPELVDGSNPIGLSRAQVLDSPVLVRPHAEHAKANPAQLTEPSDPDAAPQVRAC